MTDWEPKYFPFFFVHLTKEYNSAETFYLSVHTQKPKPLLFLKDCTRLFPLPLDTRIMKGNQRSTLYIRTINDQPNTAKTSYYRPFIALVKFQLINSANNTKPPSDVHKLQVRNKCVIIGSELFHVTQLKALQLNVLLQLFVSLHELIHSIFVQFHTVLCFNKEVKQFF